MNLPRALRGPVSAMARPARPPAEIAAVKAAAAIVRAETGLTAAEPVAKAIAGRVIAAFIADLERDADDALAGALAAVEQRLFASPFVTLATCPDIDLAGQFVAERIRALQSRSGRTLNPNSEAAEISNILHSIRVSLTRRYGRHIRGG